jgi:hypothetical protein
MKKSLVAIAAVAALGAATIPAAQAHDKAAPFIAGAVIGGIIGAVLSQPAVAYTPPPPPPAVVYAPPPPVVYAPPPRVVYAPAPVVVTRPAPVVVYSHGHYHRHHGWKHDHRRHRDWH